MERLLHHAARCGIPTDADAKEVARDFLALHLPEDFLAICDLDSLKLESGSFVEDNFTQPLFRYSLLSAYPTRPRVCLRAH